MFTKNRIYYLFKGLLLSLIITIVLLMVFSLLLTFTSLREAKLALLNNIAMIISIVVGSIYVAIKIKENGWLNGGILGLVYFIIILLFNLLFLKSFDSKLIMTTKLLLSTIIGFIGGIIGINIS